MNFSQGNGSIKVVTSHKGGFAMSEEVKTLATASVAFLSYRETINGWIIRRARHNQVHLAQDQCTSTIITVLRDRLAYPCEGGPTFSLRHSQCCLDVIEDCLWHETLVFVPNEADFCLSYSRRDPGRCAFFGKLIDHRKSRLERGPATFLICQILDRHAGNLISSRSRPW